MIVVLSLANKSKEILLNILHRGIPTIDDCLLNENYNDITI